MFVLNPDLDRLEYKQRLETIEHNYRAGKESNSNFWTRFLQAYRSRPEHQTRNTRKKQAKRSNA